MIQREELQAVADRLEEKICGGQEIFWEELQFALSKVTEDADKGLHGLICYYAALFMIQQSRHEECLCYLNESLRCLAGTSEECEMARCYNIMGLIHHSQNDNVGAMEYYGKAMLYAKQYDQVWYQSLIKSNMADAYQRVYAYEKALTCYRESIRDLCKCGKHTVNGEDIYRKILADYGYCLVMAGKMELAEDVVKKIRQSMQQHEGSEEANLAVDGFLSLWYDRIGEAADAEYHADCAVKGVIKGCTIALSFDFIMNLVQNLIWTKRYDRLKQMLDFLEPQAAIEGNEGLLLKLLLLRLEYCSDGMDRETFLQNTHSFFCLKDKFENTENCQIPRMMNLRSRLGRSREEQLLLKEEGSRLLYQTEHDELSGLYNKRYLNLYMEEIFEEALQNRLPLGILFVDIDFFKQINDRYGHQMGDSCIVAIAQSIKECMPGDFAARYGGDEFVVITSGRSREYVTERAQMLTDHIRKKQVRGEDSEGMSVTVTIGAVYAVPQKPNKMWDFLSAADSMLYEQKREKKGQVRFYVGQDDRL